MSIHDLRVVGPFVAGAMRARTHFSRSLFFFLCLVVAASLGGSACDGTTLVGTGTGGASGGGGPGGGGAGGGAPGPTACPEGPTSALGVAAHVSAGGAHTGACARVTYATRPPSSGPHYPSWPAYRTYAQPVPWGFLVHGLEHGAVVVVYNCPDGCADEVAAAQAWVDALPLEMAPCSGKPRVILAPDPTLDVRWAAAAWANTLRACSFDATAFQDFFVAHYDGLNKGRTDLESICRSTAEIDLSATGWCP